MKRHHSITGEQRLLVVQQWPAFDMTHPSLIDVDLPRKP